MNLSTTKKELLLCKVYETLFILYVGKKTDWIKWKDIFWLEVIQKIILFLFYFPRCVWFFGKKCCFWTSLWPEFLWCSQNYWRLWQRRFWHPRGRNHNYQLRTAPIKILPYRHFFIYLKIKVCEIHKLWLEMMLYRNFYPVLVFWISLRRKNYCCARCTKLYLFYMWVKRLTE